MSPSWREAGGDHPWEEGSGSPLFFRTSTLITVCWREGGRERNTTHHLTHTRNSRTVHPNNQQYLLNPTFQMGLSPASFKVLPGLACLHLNSLQTSWIFSPLHSVLLTSGTYFLGHQHLLIPNQPSFHRLTFLFALSRSVLPWFPNLLPSFSLAIHCVSLLLPFSLCFLSDIESSYSGP